MKNTRGIKVIFVGASAGGVTAIQNILVALPEHFSIPIVFVQHLPSDAVIDPALIFSRHFKGVITEAIDKMPIEPNHIYFAPPGYHLSVERDFTFSLSQDEPVHFARPSIDVLFESAAHNIGAHACGVLLTGANRDGASGLKALQDAGAYTLVQDPDDAEAPVMPKSALEIMTPDLVANIHTIGQTLARMTEGIVP